MKRSLFIVLVFFSQFVAFAQQRKIDSLLTVLKTDKADTNKLIHLNRIADEYKNISTNDKAMLYANLVLRQSDSLYKQTDDRLIRKTIIKQEVFAYNLLGIVKSNTGNYSEALDHYYASLKLSKEVNDKKAIAATYSNIGTISYNQGAYPDALKNYLFSLKTDEEISNKKGIASAYGNIGIVYYSQGNYSEALKNDLLSLKMREEIGDKSDIANSYNNISGVYAAQNNFPEALKNLFASLKINLALENKPAIGNNYNNIAAMYSTQGNYPEAIKYDSLSLKMMEAIGYTVGVAYSYGDMGSILTKQKKYGDAKKCLIKAKSIALEIGNKWILREVYNGLQKIDSTNSDFKAAFENQKMYVLYRDSIDNEETRKKTIQSQMTFDFEKKEAVANAEHKKELENQKILADEKSTKQKVVIVLVIGGLLLVLVIAGVVFRSLSITRRQKNIIEQQKNLVQLQKHEVEQQKNLIEEHQKEIIDSITYARRIQHSLLPTEKYIERNLNRLKKS